jgi:uncharacterized protein
MKKIILFITLLFLTCLSYGIEIPKPNGYVSDYENLFTSEQKQELTNILTDYEKATTIEIAILTVSDYGDDIFDFAQETATKWGIGKDSTNNGLLIVISKNYKKLRIQTGYGLEGYLPDGWLKGIGDETAEDYFKNDNFYDGTINIINECKTRIEKEGGYNYDNNKLLSDKNKKHTKNIIMVIITIVIVIIILCFVFPDTFGLLVFSLIFGGDGDSGGFGGGGGGFGGGGFGGGGAGGSW